jgi:phosphotransacetylase
MQLPNRGGLYSRPRGDTLSDVLERVLDKGLVVAGDIVVQLADVELLTLKVRLLICSADTAERMGIDWWKSDPFLSRAAQGSSTHQLQERVARLEKHLQERQPDQSRPRTERNA